MNLFKAFAPKPAKPQVPELTKISAPTASQVTKEFTLQPASQQLLTPQQTPTQFMTGLQENNLTDDSVKFLAHGMPEKESVWWASQSAEKVAAVNAAKNWVKNPTPQTQAAAAGPDPQCPVWP